ncbi:MAG: hypothetical protein Kow0020_02660 [Wenzhouxiangellaceae bacterium]
MFKKTMLLLFAWLTCSDQSLAQPLTLDENLRPHRLELRDYPDGGGVQWAAGSGVSEAGPEYIWVNGLSPLRATEIHLIADDPAVPVTMTLVQSAWNQDLDSCTTDQRALCSFQFRTYGDAGVKVQGPEGARWHLVVMTSPPADAASLLPSPFFEASRKDVNRLQSSAPGMRTAPPDTEAQGGFPLWLMVLAVLLLAVIAGALLILVKRGHHRAWAPIAVLLLHGIGSEPAQAGFSASTAGTLDALGRLQESATQGIQNDAAVRGSIDSALALLLERLQKLREAAEALDGHDPLGDCSVIGEPPGAPRIPMFCEGDSACESCYASARAGFNETRALFEQLRVIYQCTMDDVKAKVSLGDTASGVHAVVGLTWQAERAKIMQSVKGLKAAYDQKYAELRTRLHESMIEIAECEAQYGLPDWYDRFGFMYFEFLSDRYRRDD